MSKSHKAKYGQFNTGVNECEFTLNSISKYTEIKGDVLEPSFGSGNFVNSLQQYPVNIDAFEVDKLVYKSIEGVNTVLGDFLLTDFDKQYDFIVGNPPYIELTYSFYDDKEVSKLKSSYKFEGRGRVNLVHLFMDKSFELLKPNGYLGYLLPSTILSSPWYNDIRKKIYEEYTVLEIVENVPFKEVSMNICLLVLKKQQDPEHNNIVESNGFYTLSTVKSSGTTLEDKGFKVGVGGVLWYRVKEKLSDDPTNKTLVYSNNIKKGMLVYPTKLKSKIKGKKQFICHSGNTVENCIIMPRVVGKKMRAVLLENNTTHVFENHVMIITHSDIDKLRELYNVLIEEKVNFKEYFNSTNITTKEILNFRY